jgi:hypothetical protein
MHLPQIFHTKVLGCSLSGTRNAHDGCISAAFAAIAIIRTNANFCIRSIPHEARGARTAWLRTMTGLVSGGTPAVRETMASRRGLELRPGLYPRPVAESAPVIRSSV